MTFRYNFLTRPSLVFPLTLALVGLAGCQSTTEQEWASFCKNNEWAKHGYLDATNGFSIQLLSVYKDRCGDDLSETEAKLYQRGFLKGIKEFCTIENGYEMGRNSEGNPRTCPPELAKQFNAGYKNGFADYMREEGNKSLLKQQRRILEKKEAEIRRRQESAPAPP